MYDENGTYRIGINWKDIIVKIILVILFIVLLLWLFPRNDLGVFYDSVYTNNINTMRDAAERYYTGNRLPATVGESKVMTLKEMIDNKMIIRFTDKDKNYCDENASSIQVTKNATDDYVLKVHLVCGKDDDYILETLSGNGSNNGSNNGANNGSESSNVKESADKTANSSSQDDKESGTSTGSVAANSSDDVEVDYSGCTNVKDVDTGNCAIYKTAVTMYQHRKAVYYTKTVYSCPAGYIQNGTKCIKVIKGATIDATPTYSSGQTITTDALINGGGQVTEYADPIKVAIGTDYVCDEGYTKNGTFCIKYTDANEKPGKSSYKCEEGYHLEEDGVTCKKTYTATYDEGASKYTCPNDGDLSGTNCVVTKDATATPSYTCPSGYTQNGSSCYKVYSATEKTTYECPKGGTLNGTKCVVGGSDTIDATASTKKSCSSGALSGNECISTTTIDATAGIKYSCSSGTLSGKSCIKTTTIDATASQKYACSSGTPSGKNCITSSTINATAKVTYSCSSGTLSGTSCIKYSTTGASSHTEYSSWHHSGTYYYTSASKAYTGDTSKLVYSGAVSGASCGSPCGNSGIWYKYSYYTRDKSTTKTCPDGYSRDGSTCTKKTTTSANKKTTYSCPAGYSQNGTKCTKQNTTAATLKTVYSCPAGYSQNGTKCSKQTSSAATGKTVYSCPAGYSQNGTKCSKSTKTTPTSKTTYTCPNGYTQNGTKCTKGTTSSYDATAKVAYSCSEGVLEGKECKVTTKATEKTSYSCPAGYSQNGTKCTWTYVATKEEGQGAYVCPNGGVLSDKTCIITKPAEEVTGEKTYECPEGSSLEDGKCVYKVQATAKVAYGYTCPDGYTKSGEGESIVCSKLVNKEGIYYCEDASAILNGDKCLKNVDGQITGYTCPDGYDLNGKLCTKDTTEVIDAIASTKTTTSYKYMWSEKSYVECWEFTGRTKTITKNYTAGQR